MLMKIQKNLEFTRKLVKEMRYLHSTHAGTGIIGQ